MEDVGALEQGVVGQGSPHAVLGRQVRDEVTAGSYGS